MTLLRFGDGRRQFSVPAAVGLLCAAGCRELVKGQSGASKFQ
jgi:hypothetical protein